MSTALRSVLNKGQEVRGWIFNVQRFCGDDGPGIRTSVFFKGCPLRCTWCHNPESQLPKAQFSYDQERCLACNSCFEACPEQAISPEALFPKESICTLCGSCTDACPTGARQMLGQSLTVDDVLAEAMRDREFYEESGGGVTFTGGEPLSQAPFLIACLSACREMGLHTAIDTSGHGHWKDLEAAANLSDLVLYDVKGIDEERHKAMTGVSNRRILRNLYRLSATDASVWIRIPLIPGYNDDQKSLTALGCVLNDLPRRFPVWLLPYHELGRHKRNLIGSDEAPRFETPSREHVAECADVLRAYGLDVLTKGNL